MSDLFPNAPRVVSIEIQIDEAEREIGMREQVYLRRVEAGAMSREDADRKIERMKAIRDTLIKVRDRGLGPVSPPTEEHGPEEL
jgi:hypothetical protein